MGKQQGAFLRTTGTGPTSPARKCYEKLGFTVRATDTGKPLLRIPALHELVNGGPDYRPPVAVPFLVFFRIYPLKLIEVITHYLEER